jgi:O-antigen ligase
LGVVLGYAVVANGGFAAKPAVVTALGLLSAAAIAMRSRRGTVDRVLVLVMTGLLALLAGLTGSSMANGWSPAAVPVYAAVAVAGAAFVLGRSLAAGGQVRPSVDLIAAIGAVVGALGVAEVLLGFHLFGPRDGGPLDAAGPITYPNGLAALLVACLPALVVRWRWTASPWSRLAVAPAIAGLVATGSRGGLLCGAVALAIPAIAGTARSRSVATGGVVAAVAVALVGGAGGRVDLWREAATAGLAHPWFGVGPGELQLSVTPFAHNELLQAFAETGVVGLAGLVSAIVLLGVALARARPAAPSDRPLWLAAVASATALLLFGAIDFVWHFTAIVAVVFVTFGAATFRPGEEEP